MQIAHRDIGDDERERYRLEAIGAFAHEMRTPLTSIRMVLALGERLGGDGIVTLDEELARMLQSALDDLQHLADDLQETSRLERGRLALETGPCDLPAAVDRAQALLPRSIALAAADVPAVAGPWDGNRLPRAIAGFADSANRAGDGSGVARLSCLTRPDEVVLEFQSGTPGGPLRALGSEAGYAFFRGRQLILSMGGAVESERSERHCSIVAHLPL